MNIEKRIEVLNAKRKCCTAKNKCVVTELIIYAVKYLCFHYYTLVFPYEKSSDLDYSCATKTCSYAWISTIRLNDVIKGKTFASVNLSFDLTVIDAMHVQ